MKQENLNRFGDTPKPEPAKKMCGYRYRDGRRCMNTAQSWYLSRGGARVALCEMHQKEECDKRQNVIESPGDGIINVKNVARASHIAICEG